jgi:hypothetical protein
MPGSGRTARMIMAVVGAIVIIGLLAAMVATPATVAR